MKTFIIGAALAALMALPADARGTSSRHHNAFAGAQASVPSSPYTAYGAVTPFGSSVVNEHVSGGRATAIHACSGVAARYTEYTWGVMEVQQYRACMAVHGQVE